MHHIPSEISYLHRKLVGSLENFFSHNFLFIASIYWVAGSLIHSAPAVAILSLLIMLAFTIKLSPRKTKFYVCAFFIPLCYGTLLSSPCNILTTQTTHENSWKKTAKKLPVNGFIISPSATLKVPSDDIPESNFKSNNCFTKRVINKIFTSKEILRGFLKEKISDQAKDNKSAQFLQALILGYPPEKDLRERCQLLGISHILVVSGFHFLILQEILALFTSHLPQRVQKSIVIISLLFFCWILPFTPSTVRAGINALLSTLSLFTKGECSSFNRLGIGLIICSWIFPIHSISFSLTFLSTASVILFHTTISTWIRNRGYGMVNILGTPSLYLKIPINYLINSLSLTISAQILILPVLCLYFGRASLNGVFFTLILSPFIYPIFLLSFLCMFCPYTLLYYSFRLSVTFLLNHLFMKDFFLFKDFYISHLSPLLIVCYTFIAFMTGIYWKSKL